MKYQPRALRIRIYMLLPVVDANSLDNILVSWCHGAINIHTMQETSLINGVDYIWRFRQKAEQKKKEAGKYSLMILGYLVPKPM